MTSNTGSSIRYHAHKHLAREELAAAGVLTFQQFNRVDWEGVHSALTTVPRMFQVWVCKQVWGIAATNRELARWSDTSPLCPSCRQVPETCSHILQCPHEGRVEALHTTISMLDKWLKLNDTDPDLRECIYEFSMGRGRLLMEEICIENGYDERYSDGKGTRLNWVVEIYGRDDVQRNQGNLANTLLRHKFAMQHRALGEGACHKSSGGHAWTMAVW
jgi:hypothetical protein